MSVLVPAADKINADTAGLTHLHSEPPTAEGATATDLISQAFHGESGALHYLWGTVPLPVSTPLERPTDSQSGPQGGLVPSFLGRVQPGPTVAPQPPAGGSAPSPATKDPLDIVRGAVTSFRKLIGI